MGGPLDGAQMEVPDPTPGIRVPFGEPVTIRRLGLDPYFIYPHELVYQDCGLKTLLTGDQAFAYRGVL
jgi:hypothetical protein